MRIEGNCNYVKLFVSPARLSRNDTAGRLTIIILYCWWLSFYKTNDNWQTGRQTIDIHNCRWL